MMKKMNVKTTHRGTKYQIMMLYKEEKQHKLKRNKKKFMSNVFHNSKQSIPTIQLQTKSSIPKPFIDVMVVENNKDSDLTVRDKKRCISVATKSDVNEEAKSTNPTPKPTLASFNPDLVNSHSHLPTLSTASDEPSPQANLIQPTTSVPLSNPNLTNTNMNTNPPTIISNILSPMV